MSQKVYSLTVLTIHGRRFPMKIQHDMTFMKILEDVCKKYDFSVQEFDLKHHNKVLDLSMQLRYAGLPNNATLEMSKSAMLRVESEVTIVINLENGTRLTGPFLPAATIWDVISKLYGDELLNIENPVIIFTRTEICGRQKMEDTTLRSLGLTKGGAMLRFLDRTQDQLRTQANVSAPIPKMPRLPSPERVSKSHQSTVLSSLKRELEIKKEENEPEAGPSTSSWAPPLELTSNKIDDLIVKQEKPKEETPVQTMNPELEAEIEKELILLGERNAVIFNRLLDDPKLTKEEDLPDDFFELTIEDAKKLMRDLRKKREEMENSTMKTSSMRVIEEDSYRLTLLQKYKHTVLRIHFQDGLVLQALFRPTESVDTVYQFVRNYLKESDHEFHLYTAPPKRVLEPEDRFIEIGCVPAAIIHFSSSNHSPPFLKEEIMQKLSSPSAALLAAKRSRTS